ncbi:hypothetical protein Atai01_08710 [Amycolatopsis taiwanensis]|uniref:Uncharacterized protein n=1 Tax=Amycolatopsis taiwanensis TaxID=342230 RepID=A0A9W6VE90_9PSEU|nr:hypothetical protein Atai01_08710 [Amycolatopsis taiwanensis]
MHAGLLGGVLASSAWASWGTNIVLVLIAVKVIAVGRQVVLGGTGLRHGGLFHWNKSKHAEAASHAGHHEHDSRSRGRRQSVGITTTGRRQVSVG